MSCDFDKERLRQLANGNVNGAERERLLAHADRCDDCRAALRGAEALAELAARDTGRPPADLFRSILDKAMVAPPPAERIDRFWAGVGFGASLVAIALIFGWSGNRQPADAVPEFVVSLDEPRRMDLAFETDRVLEGAQITILLTGSVEIDGYGLRRELSWTEDLEAGVNRLSLPVLANGFDGGQVVVRLSHPESEQVFVVRLPVEY